MSNSIGLNSLQGQTRHTNQKDHAAIIQTMNIELAQLQKIIKQVATEELMPLYHHVQRQYKKDGSIVTVADTRVQQRLTHELNQMCPDIALLGEEMSKQQQAELLASGKPLWCLDPVDGTSNFAAGLPYFCISLALLVNGQAQLGVVYDPVRDECFSAQAGLGARLNDQPLITQPTELTLNRCIALVDFKRLPKQVRQRLIDDTPYGSQRNMGSIALELCWLAAGRAHIYLHGSQNLWDYAAAELIIQEAGATISSLDGSTIATDSLAKRSACAAVTPQLHQNWLDYLQAIPYDV